MKLASQVLQFLFFLKYGKIFKFLIIALTMTFHQAQTLKLIGVSGGEI